MDLNKKVIEIEESFRNGKIDNRIGFLRGDFETFEQWIIETFELEKYYDVENEDISEDEINYNMNKLNKVIFEECIKRLRKELGIV